MAEYHYKYNPSGSSGGPVGAPNNGNRNDNQSDFISWVVVVIGFAVFAPLGAFLLALKLLRGANSHRSSANRTAAARTTYTYQGAQSYQKPPSASAQTTRAARVDPLAGTQAQRPLDPKAGRGFLISGGIVTGIFLFSFLMAALDVLMVGIGRGDLPALVSLLCFTGIGGALLWVGFSRRKKVKLFRKYLGLIGMRQNVSISTLANATRQSHRKVCDDLQDMLDQGILPVGYLDLANDRLVLTTQGIEDEVDEAAAEPEEARPDDSILAEIRAVNDSIPDPVMTAKIARIEEITGKILDYQRRYPAKAGQLRNFLSYYLPTTLKILRAYAQLQEQGIEGENISAAKARIEGMMDKVVEGFEKQLDKLFQDDVLDISSDVAVLEKMLDNDGLGSSGMPLGGV